MQENIIALLANQPIEPWKGAKHGLPAQLTPLLGRNQEVESICTLLQNPQTRLITLTGAGGIGKTRLSIEIAEQMLDRFADGICYVPLALIRDPGLTLPTIAHEFGIQETGTRTLLETVKSFLHNKRLLLLLDNFEQIISAAPLLEDLLTSCQFLTILVTSREVLHLRAEYIFPVPPLVLPDLNYFPECEELAKYSSIAFFLQRAQENISEFQLTQANARTIAEICVRLDGLPLALELAAARIRLLPLQALLARLSQRLQVLTRGVRSMPERHQTLRNTIAWSFDLLEVSEQCLFRRLSIFVGGCTLDEIEAIYSILDGNVSTGEILDSVTSLIDKSLLQQQELEGEPRLQFLETIREFGLNMLVSSGEFEATRYAHACYYLTLAVQAESELEGPQQAVWLERLEKEHDNFRMALNWFMEQGDKESILRMTVAISRFLMIHGYISEGRRWLEEGLEGSVDVMTVVRVKALHGAGVFATLHGEIDEAELLCGESLELCREIGERRVMAQSLALLGFIALSKNNFASARTMEEEALVLFREVHDSTGIANVLEYLASVLSLQGEFGKAQALLEESLALSRRGGDVWNITLSLLFLGWVSSGQGNYADARAQLEESLKLSLAKGNMWIIAIGLVGLASVAAAQKELVRAVWLMSAGEVVRKSIGLLLPQFVHAMHESTMITATEKLDEQTFASAWTEGQTMTLEQILVAMETKTIPVQLSGEFSIANRAKRTFVLPDGLTTREVEVLRIVAQGMTDAQIASQLVISKRTVNWHLTSIYSKIQVSSRSAATRYAIEHNLL